MCIRDRTTSRAFPQIFIAKVMELPERGEQMARANVEAALRKMVQFQRGDGGFNYWPGGDHYDTWTSIYAGHFLVEAERAGYAMPGNVKSNWLAFQRKQAREWNGVGEPAPRVLWTPLSPMGRSKLTSRMVNRERAWRGFAGLSLSLIHISLLRRGSA